MSTTTCLSVILTTVPVTTTSSAVRFWQRRSRLPARGRSWPAPRQSRRRRSQAPRCAAVLACAAVCSACIADRSLVMVWRVFSRCGVGFRRQRLRVPLSLRALRFPVRYSGVYSRFGRDYGCLQSLMRAPGSKFHSIAGVAILRAGINFGDPPVRGRAEHHPDRLRQGRKCHLPRRSGCTWIPHAVAHSKAIGTADGRVKHLGGGGIGGNSECP